MKYQGNLVPTESSVQVFFVKVALDGAINRKLLLSAEAQSLSHLEKCIKCCNVPTLKILSICF